jgi:hypothetical protein
LHWPERTRRRYAVKNRRVFPLFLSVALCVVALAALLVLVGDPARAEATTRYVATTGVDTGDCIDPNNPCGTVQYAVDAADEEDLIKVATGTYTGVQGRPAPPEYLNPPASGIITQAVFISKTVTIRGGYATPGFADPPDPETNPTTLDAQNQGRVLWIGGFWLKAAVRGRQIHGTLKEMLDSPVRNAEPDRRGRAGHSAG